MKEKPEINAETMKKIIQLLTQCSPGEMEDYVKQSIIKFNEEEHTPSEMYDFLQSISDIPIIKFDKNSCMGDISTFVQAVCNMKKFYKKPK